MDPAAVTPPRELQEAVIDSASKLIYQLLEHEGEASLYSVEANLQHLMSSYPWLLDSLHPLVQDFVLHELHLHPPAATAHLLASTEDVPSEPPDEGLPGLSEPSPRKKRRLCRRRGTPQPDVGTCKQSAVVSERDTFSAASDSETVFSGAIFCVPSEVNNGFSVSPMAGAPQTALVEPTFRVNDCVHTVSKPGVTEFSFMSLENENVWDSFSSALVNSGEAVDLTETALPDHIPPSTPSPQFNVGSVTQLAVQLAVQSAGQLPSVQSAGQLPSVQSAGQLPSVQSAGQLPSVQSAGQLPSVLLASPPPITPSLQSSPLPVGQSVVAPLPIAQLPLVHLSAHSLIQSPSSPSRYEQGTHFTTTSAGSLKLVTSETVAPSRASPEAGCRSPADSGPLEVKTPAPAVSPGDSPEQSRLSAPPESSSEFTRPPPSSAECIGEHFQPSEDCIPLLLPESSHCAAQFQPVSTPAEVCVPAASVSVSAGGPESPVQPQVSLAGGSGEPRQHPASSAGGSEEPSQLQVSSAGGSEEPSQPQVSSAGGPESPVQPQVSLAGGSGEPSQLQVSSAGGSGEPSQLQVSSAGGSGEPSQLQVSSAGGSGEPSQLQVSSAGGSGEPSQPQVSSAGGPEEPVQPRATSAGGSEGPVQPPVSAGGSEGPVQPPVSSAGGSEEPVQPPVSSAGGSEEPVQHHTSLAQGPGGPRQHILPSAGGPGRAVQPSPAESSPATSTSPPAASSSTPAAAASSSTPAAAASSSTPAAAASSSTPAAVPLPSGSAAVPLPSGSAAVPLPSGSAAVPLPSGSAAVPLPSGPAPVSSSTPAASSPAASSPAAVSLLSGSAAAPPSSGPDLSTSGPASSGPAVATPSWDPARPVPPPLRRPFSRPLSWRHGRRGRPPEGDRRRCWHCSRPPDLLSGRRCRVHGRPPELFARGRHCLPSGRPPEGFCLHRRHCRVHGRPPDLFWLLCGRPPGRPPELLMDSC
ncbi:hypothetical protein ACER0C_001485 [Sarotherodon galilaeus]